MTIPRPLLDSRSRVVAVVLLGGVGVLAGCGSGTPVGTADLPAASTPAPALIVAANGRPASLTITPVDGTKGVSLDAPVTVTTDSGWLDSVAVHSDADPTALAGAMSDDHRTWTLAGGLDPATHYVVDAAGHSLGGTTHIRGGFSTMATPSRLTTDVYPSDGATVGVGMPIILRFSDPVAADKQANLVKHIEVQTSTPIEGAWHWYGDQEVHFRPKDYWPTGMKVNVVGHFRGLSIGGGTWGLGDWSSAFTVGAKHVSIIDAAAHQMQVFENDNLIHTYPVSTGVDGKSPTISGTLFVWYKLQKVRMVSTSIGIPVTAPNGYDEDVFWDTAISTDGFFIHAAPWSVWAQGSQNVSHGCVNLSNERAIEFYNFSTVGDIVQVKNTSRTADWSDGEADWQIPFAQYANSGGQTTPPPAAPGASGGGL